MSAPILEADRQQRRAADPDASVWVEASAGSGKTKVLTDRLLNLLLAGSRPERLLCLTFTKAAAAEMANRLADKLSLWAVADEATLDGELAKLSHQAPSEEIRLRARRLFALTLDTPGGLRIQTVHGFCQSLLGRFPLEAGVPPHFSVIEERDAKELMQASLRELLGDEKGEIKPSLATVLAYAGESGFPDLMSDLARARGRLARLLEKRGGVAGVAADLAEKLGISVDDREEDILSSACRAIDVGKMRDICELLLTGGKNDGKRGESLARFLAAPDEQVENFSLYHSVFFTDKGDIRAHLLNAASDKRVPWAKEFMLSEAHRLAAIEEHRRAAVLLAVTKAMLIVGWDLLERYRRHKTARAKLDYDDLILKAGDLLKRSEAAAWVLYKLDGGIDHVLIDESQDTNPEQWEVVSELAREFFAGEGAREEKRSFFAVGDAKQSIYSFQGADPAYLGAMRQRFADWVRSAGKRWEEVPLFTSFRSVQAVLDAVDSVFLDPEARKGLTLGGDYVRHLAFRRGEAGRVELWPLIEKLEGEEAEPWKPPVERIAVRGASSRLAVLLAKKIAAMIGQEILPARARAIEAGDIMILVRRRGGFVADLVRELKGLNVPVAGVDRMILSQQMAVMDLLAIARFVLLPADDLNLAAILKGPLIGFDEEKLFDLAHARAGGLWSELTQRREENPLFTAAHAELSRLLGEADFSAPYAFFARLLGAGGGRRKLLSWLGPDAADPLDEFLELALTYEQDHVPSLTGFLAWLEAGATEVKRNLEQSKGGAVRIMTVHGAKGLQAPIIFLPDTASQPSKSPRLLWSGDRDEALPIWLPRKGMAEGLAKDALEETARLTAEEYRRLLYVAMTRAEDRIYVCGWAGKSSPGNWHQLVEQALVPLASEIVEESGAFSADHPILRMETSQDRKIEARKPVIKVDADQKELPSWFFAPVPAEPAPPRPLAPSRPEGEEPPVRSPLATLDENRFLRGRLIHRLLQSLPDVAKEKRPAAAARFLASQAIYWLEAAREALIAEVLAVLDHPEFAPLFGPGSLAEVPVVGVLGERVISGQIDRLVVTKSEVLIIDYKTNRPPPKIVAEVPDIYRRQMAAYRQALSSIWSEKRIRCLLLWTDGPFITEIDE